MTIKCMACGTEFPADSAKCKMCQSPMMCAEGMCKCTKCEHTQSMDNMWCEECLRKNSS